MEKRVAHARQGKPDPSERPAPRPDSPDPGREDQGPAREDRPGRPSPHTDDPVGPDRPRDTPLVSVWAEEDGDPPSQRPSDSHEDQPRRRKAS